MSSEPTPNLGPQCLKDPPFTARMRLHQSWYRANVLKVPFGIGPKPSNTTYYGNMLTRADGEKGLNFLTPHIFAVTKRRLAEKKGAMDPFRLLCNMLSSQPMCFNLFGPLVDDLELATVLFKTVFPNEIAQVMKVHLEYSPDPSHEYLDDRTAFDAFVDYIRPDGERGFIGIDTKFTERFTPKAFIRPAYWRWTQQADSPWPEASWPKLIDQDINQLWRDHLLAEALLHHARSPYVAGYFLVIFHPSDTLCGNSLEKYHSLLKPEYKGFSEISLEEIIQNWIGSVQSEKNRTWLSGFITRYLDFSLSDIEQSSSPKSA